MTDTLQSESSSERLEHAWTYVLVTVGILVVVLVAYLLYTQSHDESMLKSGSEDIQTLPQTEPVTEMLPTDTQQRGATSEVVPGTTSPASDVPAPKTLSQEIIMKWTGEAEKVWEGGEYTLRTNDEYKIDFSVLEDHVGVYLRAIPYQEAHAHAEAFLRTELNASPEELCSMNIDVFLPLPYDPMRAQDMGFSTCPGPKTPKMGNFNAEAVLEEQNP